MLPQNRRVVNVLAGFKMMTQSDTYEKEESDADLEAVRKVIAGCADDAPPQTTERTEAEDASLAAGEGRGKWRFPQLKKAPDSEQALPLNGQTGVVASACRTALSRMKTYRPERKRILRTSLVLMLLLQPFFVIGWTVFLIGLVVALYVFWGGDVFWRKLIAVYQAAERKWPAPARQLKIRSYVISKRWNSLQDRIPQQVADRLRGPDLRQLAMADAQHEAILSERLGRL